MKSIATFLGAALLCSSLAVSAQTPPPAGAAERKPPTPEQREKFRTEMKAAHEACSTAKDKQACMAGSYCAKQADPAKCQVQAKERQAEHAKHRDTRQAIAEACSGKRGDDLKSCYRSEAEKRGLKPGHGHGHRKG